MNCFSSLIRATFLRHRLAAGLAGALLLGGLGSCVEEEESVIVLGMPTPEKEGEALRCEIKPGGERYLQAIPVDLSFNTGLTIPVELQNNLLAVNAKSVNSGVDNSEMRVRSVDVKITAPQLPAIEESVRAVNPNYLQFNLPLASDSFSGGASRKAVFVTLPADTMSKYRDAIVANGFSNGTEVQLEVELRFHFDLTGGQGKIVSRSYRAPVLASMGGLRKCVPTSWKDPDAGDDDDAKVYELCTNENCASAKATRFSFCGDAQLSYQSPLCCDGPEHWKDTPNAPEICGVPR